jgi:FtsZ-binding cell division protein ZapB
MKQGLLTAVALAFAMALPTLAGPAAAIDPHAACKKEIAELEAKVRELRRKNTALEKECATLKTSSAHAREETKQWQAKFERSLGRTESQAQRIRQAIKDETLFDGMTVDETKEALRDTRPRY